MRLRNKKTGVIFDGSIVVCLDEENGRFAIKDNPVCETISELNERFEDYTPKEPLIKDEKIDYLEIKHLVKEAMREAEEERVKRLAQYYATLCGEEE